MTLSAGAHHWWRGLGGSLRATGGAAVAAPSRGSVCVCVGGGGVGGGGHQYCSSRGPTVLGRQGENRFRTGMGRLYEQPGREGGTKGDCRSSQERL